MGADLFTVEIKGLKECQAALVKLGEQPARAVMLEVLTKYGEGLAEAARGVVEVDHGDLRRSIIVSQRLTAAAYAGAEPKADAEERVYIGPTAEGFYGFWLEFGTHKMPAEPFMRPAWDAGKDAIPISVAADLWAAISSAMARRGG